MACAADGASTRAAGSSPRELGRHGCWSMSTSVSIDPGCCSPWRGKPRAILGKHGSFEKLHVSESCCGLHIKNIHRRMEICILVAPLSRGS